LTRGYPTYGFCAVIAFYFITGYYTAMSYPRFQNHSATPLKSFYLDRILRLYPTFFLVYCIALGSRLFLSPDGALVGNTWLYELFVIPQNYTRFLKGASNLIQTGWWLGALMQLYLLFPLLMMLSARQRCLLAFLLALGQVMTLVSPWPLWKIFPACREYLVAIYCNESLAASFGYRLIVCGGMSFVLGIVAHDARANRASLYTFRAIIAIYAVLYLAVFIHPLHNWHVADVCVGVFVFIPIAYVLLQAPMEARRSVSNYLDRLSFPLFLVHGPVIWIVQNYWHLPGNDHKALCIVLSLALSVLCAEFQSRADSLRYKVRGFKNSGMGNGV
ncbi:MAG: acyltransferase, partial [Rickettsiales bacterium]|nr:acyltransferase [Rickettsiales bacterium]